MANRKVEQSDSSRVKDFLLYGLIVLLGGCGLWICNLLQGYDWAVHASIWLTVGALALFVFAKTQKGGYLVLFFSQAYGELVQVVWPSWGETKKVTAMVALLVGVMSVILWMVDMMLSALVTKIVG